MHVCVCVRVLDSFINASIFVEYLLCTGCWDIVVSNKDKVPGLAEVPF